jgi:NAD(P)-dependent dehydrogenase (short-subunit alcohol dehydrogenase family)
LKRDTNDREEQHGPTSLRQPAQEIADAIVLLASPRSASTTGAELVVDSGFLKAS